MIIITGAAGFIGSAAAYRLNELGREDLLLVDELGDSEKWRNLSGLRFTDYLEKQEFREILRNPASFPGVVDGILHLGACSCTTEGDASYLMDNNFAYSKEVAIFAHALDARMVYASSAATYGDGSQGYDDTGDFRKLRPLNAYALSKQMFDLWADAHGMLESNAGIKYFNVFGPNEYHKGAMRSMVCRGYEQIRDTGEIRLFASEHPDYSDGEQLRDFLYIRDAVEMTLFLLEARHANGLFNAGSGEAVSWNRLARAIFTALGLQENITYIPMPEELRGKYQYITRAETGAIRAAGYSQPVTPLEEAVREYVCDYLMPGLRLAERRE